MPVQYTRTVSGASFPELLATAFETVRRDVTIGEIIYSEVIDTPALRELFTVDSNPIPGDPIPWMRPLEYGTVEWVECGQEPVTPQVTAGVTTYPTLTSFHSRLQKCFDDLVPMLAKYRKNGNLWLDVEGTELLAWVTRLFIQMRQRDQFRIAFFADSGLAASDLKDASLLPHYNAMDGLWKIMSTQAAAEPKQLVSIPENAEITTAAQTALAGDRAYQVFKEMRNKYEELALLSPRDNDIFSQPTAGTQINATFSLWQNYRNYLESENKRFNVEATVGGVSRIAFDGMDIVSHPWIDQYIREDFSSTDGYDRPHRAFIYNRADAVYGVDDPAAVNGVEGWYNRDTQNYNLRGAYKAFVALRTNNSFVIAE